MTASGASNPTMSIFDHFNQIVRNMQTVHNKRLDGSLTKYRANEEITELYLKANEAHLKARAEIISQYSKDPNDIAAPDYALRDRVVPAAGMAQINYLNDLFFGVASVYHNFTS